MSRRSAIHVEALRERYPIGNNASRPTIHIYQDGERAWELTELRLKVWATGIVRNNSFDHQIRLSTSICRLAGPPLWRNLQF
jgi:hypothetical protein